MNKIIKKIAVVLVAMLLVMMVLPAQDVRAEEDTYTVYVQIPDDWGDAYIWAWNDGGNYFTDWPGDVLNDNGDGWYTYELPTSYVDFLISNRGSQTENIKVVPHDVEVVIYSDWSYIVSYKDGYTPEEAEKINITVTVPEDWEDPCIWAWDKSYGDVYNSWPGAPMTVSGDTYTAELPDWVTGVIINANNASVQTIDISVEAGKDIWLQVNSTDNIVVEYTGPTAPEGDDGSGEETTTPVGDDTSNDATTAPDAGQDNNNGGKENNNNVIYIVITVAVFVIIILIVTFTGNGRNKKHSQRKYEEDTDLGDIKVDDKDLDIDVDDIDV